MSKQDVLHIRDAVSKTITVTETGMKMVNDLDYQETEISNEFASAVDAMFQFSYNRADEFNEDENGVTMSISGGQYEENIGNVAQNIFEEMRA